MGGRPVSPLRPGSWIVRPTSASLPPLLVQLGGAQHEACVHPIHDMLEGITKSHVSAEALQDGALLLGVGHCRSAGWLQPSGHAVQAAHQAAGNCGGQDGVQPGSHPAPCWPACRAACGADCQGAPSASPSQHVGRQRLELCHLWPPLSLARWAGCLGGCASARCGVQTLRQSQADHTLPTFTVEELERPAPRPAPLPGAAAGPARLPGAGDPLQAPPAEPAPPVPLSQPEPESPHPLQQAPPHVPGQETL